MNWWLWAWMLAKQSLLHDTSGPPSRVFRKSSKRGQPQEGALCYLVTLFRPWRPVGRAPPILNVKQCAFRRNLRAFLPGRPRGGGGMPQCLSPKCDPGPITLLPAPGSPVNFVRKFNVPQTDGDTVPGSRAVLLHHLPAG